MSKDPDSSPIGRLAPSPTGYLHLGHARTFLLAWWHLRSRGGQVLMRIEDLDRERSRPEYETALLHDLEWLGIDWDGPITRQSEHPERFEQALAQLEAAGLTYPCVCTRRELESAASAPHVTDGMRPYPGTCKSRFASPAQALADTGRQPALRFRCPPGKLSFTDALHGLQHPTPAVLHGDFPVARRDGTPAYQLAVVVDDAHQGITEVHRGDDLLGSTSCQILLSQALHLPEPAWFHFPLVHDSTGRRLAKRHGSLALKQLREAGVEASTLVRWIAHSAAIPAPIGVSAQDIIPAFNLSQVPRSPVQFTLPDLGLGPD